MLRDEPAPKMKSPSNRINTFFMLAVVLSGWIGFAGCSTPGGDETGGKDGEKAKKSKKEVSTLRLHLEANDDTGFGTRKIRILRRAPVDLIVRREPFIDEGDIKMARVINTPDGGFSIGVQLTTHGQLVLGMETTANRGRRVAVYSMWTEGRWLGAPQILRTIEDGVFVFTPDCNREEAERIVKGLNRVAVELKNQPKPGKKAKEEDDDDMMKRFRTYK